MQIRNNLPGRDPYRRVWGVDRSGFPLSGTIPPLRNQAALIPSILIKFSVSYRNHTAFLGLIPDEGR